MSNRIVFRDSLLHKISLERFFWLSETSLWMHVVSGTILP